MSLYEASDVHQSLLLSDATLAALELPQQPFGSLEPNAASFSDETTAEQIADVKQALITGDDLLLILGDEGAGKTVMLKQLGEHSGNRIQSFAVRGSERFSTMNLFAGLLEAFKHSPPEQLQDILNDLIPYLQTMITRNTLSVIVLDDAHKVRDHELTQLLSAMLYINSHDENVMRIAMAAPAEFESRIPDLLPQGADLPYSSLMITGFSPTRAAEFIDFRMQQAGLRGEAPFAESEIQDLVDHSDGLPGPLQIAAVDALNEQYGPVSGDLSNPLLASGTSPSFLQTRFGKMALGTVAVFCIALGILMSLPGRSNEEAGRYTVTKTEPITLSDSDSELRLVENKTTAATTPTQTTNNTSSSTTKITFDNESSVVEPTNNPSATLTANAKSEPASNPSLVANATANNSLVKSATPTTAEITPSVIENKPIVIVEAPTAPSDVKEAAAASTAEIAPKTPEIVSAPSEQATNSSGADNGGTLESSSWILLQDRARYTIQMSASRDKDSVISFLESHSSALSAPNSIYSFTRNGSDWFALLHGLYDTVDEARLAVEMMPAEALTNQPWIRSVARVQDVLKAQ